MNGYSYYAREVVLHTIVGYYYSNPTQSPYVGFYHRLSSSVCDGDAVGWSELSAGGYSPLPEPPSFKFYAELSSESTMAFFISKSRLFSVRLPIIPDLNLDLK